MEETFGSFNDFKFNINSSIIWNGEMTRFAKERPVCVNENSLCGKGTPDMQKWGVKVVCLDNGEKKKEDTDKINDNNPLATAKKELSEVTKVLD